MTKPYSEDLRTRVVAAVVVGASCRDAAKRFSIGVSSVVRWAQRFRRTGSVAAKPMGGERNSRLKDERDWLLARIAAAPDLPLHDISPILGCASLCGVTRRASVTRCSAKPINDPARYRL